MKYEKMYRVVGPRMVAGLGIGPDLIVHWTAPIIIYMVGWDFARVSDYCNAKRWLLEFVGETP